MTSPSHASLYVVGSPIFDSPNQKYSGFFDPSSSFIPSRSLLPDLKRTVTSCISFTWSSLSRAKLTVGSQSSLLFPIAIILGSTITRQVQHSTLKLSNLTLPGAAINSPKVSRVSGVGSTTESVEGLLAHDNFFRCRCKEYGICNDL